MGGATSRFEETDWTRATGRLIAQEDEQDHPTIDGSSPTRSYRQYEIIKQSKMTSQREFEVLDPKKRHRLYTTRAVPGTLAWFDVLGPNLDQIDGDDLKLRVETDLSRQTWMVYRYHTPVFEGQRPATLKVRKGLADGVKLYKAACITVSWSRYTAVAAKYRPPSLEDVLQIEEEGKLASPSKTPTLGSSSRRLFGRGNGSNRDENLSSSQRITPSSTPTSAAARVSSFFRRTTSSIQDDNPNDGDEDGENDDDDMMAHAARIAASRRSITIDVSPKGANEKEASPKDNTMSPSERLEANRRRVQKALESCSSCHSARNDSPETRAFDNLSDYIKRQPSSSAEDDPTTTSPSLTTPTGSATKLREMFQKAKSNSLSTRLFGTAEDDEYGADQQTKMNAKSGEGKDANRNNSSNSIHGTSNRNLTQSEQNELNRQKALEKAMEGIIDLGKDSNSTSNVAETNTDGGIRSNDSGTIPIDYDDDDPTAAPPALLLCQEIYNKLIGTHQTSYVSRDEVLQMLAMEEASQQKGSFRAELSPHNEPAGATPTASSSESNPMIHAVESFQEGTTSAASTPSSKRKNSWLGFGLIPKTASIDESVSIAEEPPTKTTASSSGGIFDKNNENENATKISAHLEDSEEQQLMTLDEILPSGLQSLLDNDLPTPPTSKASSTRSTPKNNATSIPATNTSSSSLRASQPLVGYWTWKNTYKVHKMRLHLAKNSDLAMHVVLAILVNQVRYERNAVAMTV